MRGRANRGVLWIYRARKGSRQKDRCTWALMRAHLRQVCPGAMKEMGTRGRGRPRVDTGSRPAPDIGSSCPGPKCRPVASLARAKPARQQRLFPAAYTATPDPRAPIYTSYVVPRCAHSTLGRVGKNPNVHVVPHTVVTTNQPSEPCYGHGAATRLSSRPDRFTCHLSTIPFGYVAPRTRTNDTLQPSEPQNSPARSYAKRQTDSRPRFPTSERLTCARISKWRLLLPGIHWRSHSQFPVRYDSYGQRRPYTPRHRFR